MCCCCCCLRVWVSQPNFRNSEFPNFTLNWPYACMNAIQMLYVYAVCTFGQSHLDFDSSISCRFAFILFGKNCFCVGTKTAWNPKPWILFTQRIHKNYAISFDFTAALCRIAINGLLYTWSVSHFPFSFTSIHTHIPNDLFTSPECFESTKCDLHSYNIELFTF